MTAETKQIFLNLSAIYSSERLLSEVVGDYTHIQHSLGGIERIVDDLIANDSLAAIQGRNYERTARLILKNRWGGTIDQLKGGKLSIASFCGKSCGENDAQALLGELDEEVIDQMLLEPRFLAYLSQQQSGIWRNVVLIADHDEFRLSGLAHARAKEKTPKVYGALNFITASLPGGLCNSDFFTLETISRHQFGADNDLEPGYYPLLEMGCPIELDHRDSYNLKKIINSWAFIGRSMNNQLYV